MKQNTNASKAVDQKSFEADLRFLSNEADEDEGLGHAGIETFKDAPYAGVARECGQNSADAGTGKPVKISFDLIAVPTDEFPPYNSLLATIDICLDKAEDTDDEKAIEFFSRAKQILAQKTIKILRISDYNTTGLVGPSKSRTPFHSLVKSSGVCKKDSDISGGSFGIGKNAAFAVSELQTVFYSTIYKDPKTNQEKFLAQGKSILISHVDEQGQPKRATGYWGAAGDGYPPIDDPEQVPEWLRRVECGTSIFATGFRDSHNWQHHMAASIVTNFFCAIHRNEMEFTLDDKNDEYEEIVINSSTLAKIFEDKKVQNAAEENNDLHDFIFSKNLYTCLVSGESIEKEFQIKNLGAVSVRTLVKEGMPQRMCIVRKGMVITDSLKHFGSRFERFPMFGDFITLVEPKDEAASSLIRKLENPSHNDLSAERVSDPKKRRVAISAMKELAKVIREAIKDVAFSQPEGEIALDEMSEFFADADHSDQIPDPDQEENPETVKLNPIKTTPKKKKGAKAEKEKEGDEGGGVVTGLGGGGGGGGGGDGPTPGQGSGGKGTRSYRLPIELKDIRNIVVDKSSGKKRMLFFTASEDASVFVKIEASGLYANVNLSVVSVSNGNIDPQGFSVEVQKNQRAIVEVELSEPYEGPIELFAEKQVGGNEN